jgi:hypothetical protein
VNIDNGLGAATAAHRLLTRMRIAAKGRVELSGQAVAR